MLTLEAMSANIAWGDNCNPSYFLSLKVGSYLYLTYKKSQFHFFAYPSQ